MGVFVPARQQVFRQQPNAVNRLQQAVILAALQLLADNVAPSVNHPLRQMAVGQQLDFNLAKPACAVFGLDIHHAEFVVEKLLVVVRVEYLHLGDWRAQIVGQYRVEEMRQQVAVFLRAQQGFENAVYLGVNTVFHA